MPSADFCAAFGSSLPSRQSDHKGHGRQQRRPPEVSLTAFRTPPPNLRRARLMDMDFAASRPLVPRPPPLIRFLCIGACVCSTLPSDPTSRLAIPLRFANLHLHQVGRGLSPPSCQTCSAHGIARRLRRAGEGNRITHRARWCKAPLLRPKRARSRVLSMFDSLGGESPLPT